MDLLRNLRKMTSNVIPLRADVGDWSQGAANGPTGYNAATQGRRLAGYAGTTRGGNSLALGDGPQLRARARKAALDNQWVVSAIRGFRADVIGDGIKPHFQHPNPDIRRHLKKLWDRWVKEADSSFDPSTRKSIRDFYSGQAYITGEVMEAGEVFIRLRQRYLSDGFTVPLQVQMIDAEQLPYWKMDGGVGNNIVRGGIEFDPLGRRVAYHMYSQNPGDSIIWPNALDIKRIPGQNVLHVFEPMRGNPIRGITWLASILVKLEDLRQYDDADVLSKKLATFFVGAKTQANPGSPLFPVTQSSGTSTAPDGVGFSDVEPGTILDLDGGDELTWNAPPGVSTQYATFMTVQLQAISRVLMRCYHQLSGDVSKTSFSSIRADINNVRRELEQFQFGVIATQYCDPILKAWLDQAALAGAIDAVAYAANPGDYYDVEWRTARWAYVNPQQDIEAEKEMNRCGYKPWSQSVIEMGGDPDIVRQQRKQDQDADDDLKLVRDSDPRRPSGRNAVDITPEAEQEAGDTTGTAIQTGSDDENPKQKPAKGKSK